MGIIRADTSYMRSLSDKCRQAADELRASEERMDYVLHILSSEPGTDLYQRTAGLRENFQRKREYLTNLADRVDACIHNYEVNEADIIRSLQDLTADGVFSAKASGLASACGVRTGAGARASARSVSPAARMRLAAVPAGTEPSRASTIQSRTLLYDDWFADLVVKGML